MKNATNKIGSNQFASRPKTVTHYVYIYLAAVALIISGSLAYKSQHPTEHFINPVIAMTTEIPHIAPRTVNSDPNPAHAYIMTKHHADILWRMYGLESSFGRNDGCKAHGGFNGFGFAQNTSTWNCFDSFTEVVDRVDQWLDRELATKTLAQALCYYNQGLNEDTCTYAHNFLNL